MTKKLGEAFFGDKKITEKLYTQITARGEFDADDIRVIFEPYTSKLAAITAINGDTTLFDLFSEFLLGVMDEFESWQFQKFSSVVEIAAHVFEHSFQQWLTQDQSFKYFSDVVVRHSLFRPPHSVCIFNEEQLQAITKFWINHFHRYYPYYQECLQAQLNEVLVSSPLPLEPLAEKDLKQAKAIDKGQFAKLLQ